MTELDALMREIVLLRDDYRCRMCGTGKKAGRGGGLQAAHILPKGGFPSLRHEPDNLLTLCARCHIYGPNAWHRSPDYAMRWCDTHLGPTWVPRLRRLAEARRKRQDPALLRIYLTQLRDKMFTTRAAIRAPLDTDDAAG